MPDLRQTFFISAEKNAFDTQGFEIMKNKLSCYKNRQTKAKAYYTNIELARNQALYIRSKGIDNIETYLKEFESHFTARKGKVIWALDEESAISAILQIIKSTQSKKIIASHSATINEIFLKEQLPKDVTFVETAFHDFINQITGDENIDLLRTSHKDFINLLSEKFQTKINPDPKQIVNFICGKMRNYFFDADMVITGANFLVANAGCIALSENEGNICRACAFPKTHIVVASYDKIIPSLSDIETLWTLFASSGDGTLLTAYNHLIFGPRTEHEEDGPENMYVIILNNGRDAVLKQREQRKALHCIRCGACKRYCPVWQTIGEKAYHTPYTGPIGSVLMPLMNYSKAFHYMAYAVSANEKAQQHCPVKIPLYELSLYNRSLFTKENHTNKFFLWNQFVKHCTIFFSNRKMMNFGNASQKTVTINMLMKKHWGSRRSLPVFAKKNFNELYRIQHP